jgi:hypothetical protein
MNVRIVKRPSGEAPENIRDAWIGLVLPVRPRFPHAITARSFGVLTGPRNRLTSKLRTFMGGGEPTSGYAVDPGAAIELPKQANPLAAAWWLANAPHVLKNGRSFLFDEDCCRVEPGESSRGSK